MRWHPQTGCECCPADEARQRFPRHVEVLTSHSLALRQVRNRGYSDEKLFNVLNGNAITRVLGLRSIELENYALMDFEVGHAVRGTIGKFCQSDSAEILFDHVPENGLLERLSEKQLAPYRRYVREQADVLWSLMCSRENNGVPLGHDGYFKLWSLSAPQLPYEFVLLDEAQDSNPALVHVLRNQKKCQQVFVGDRYQQIYEWRGAVNAMEQLTAQQCFLTRSFRYGQHIADFATVLLEPLGNTAKLSGRSDIKGGFCSENPDAYISRTNAKLVETLVQLESRIHEVYVIACE